MPFFVGHRPRRRAIPPLQRAPGVTGASFYPAGTILQRPYKTRAAAEAAALQRWPGEQAVVIEAANTDQAMAMLGTARACPGSHHRAAAALPPAAPLNEDDR